MCQIWSNSLQDAAIALDSQILGWRFLPMAPEDWSHRTQFGFPLNSWATPWGLGLHLGVFSMDWNKDKAVVKWYFLKKNIALNLTAPYLE